MQLSISHCLWCLSVQGRISSAGDDPDFIEPRILINTHSIVLREIVVIRAEFLLIRGSNLSYRLNVGYVFNWDFGGRFFIRFVGR